MMFQYIKPVSSHSCMCSMHCTTPVVEFIERCLVCRSHSKFTFSQHRRKSIFVWY